MYLGKWHAESTTFFFKELGAMTLKVLPFWPQAVSSSKALKVLLIATLISLKMQNAQSWMIDSTFFFVKVTFERLWYEQTLFAHLIELVELLFLQSIKLIWYLDFFHIFISMSSWLEGEERELRSEGTRVQISMPANQLKGEIEGRADCVVREWLEEEEISFL